MSGNNLFVLIRMKAKTGHEKAVEEELLTQIKQTRAAPGCLKADLYRSTVDLVQKATDPSRYALQVRWQDPAAFRAYMASMANSPQEMAQKAAMFDGRLEPSTMITPPTDIPFNLSDKVKTIFRVKAKADCLEAVKQGVLDMLKLTAATPGPLRQEAYQGLQGASDPAIFIVDQIWLNQDTLDKVMGQLVTNPPFSLADLAEPLQVSIFEIFNQPPTAKAVSESESQVSVHENAVLGDEVLKAGLRQLHPEFGDLCIRASGETWGKPLLDQKTKVLIAIVVDVVEQITGKPFENHLHMARQQGITREELEELFLFMMVYAGFNKAGVFFAEMNRIFGPR